MGRVWGGPDAPGQAATSDAAQHDPTYIHKFPTPVGTLALTLLRSPFHSNPVPLFSARRAARMANSGSGSAEMYWDAFVEEVGSCPGAEMEAAPPSAKSVAAALCSGCAAVSGAG